MHFKDFNLDASILKAVEDAGFSSPTPIQEKAIPAILEGSDILASAQTGTGKTAAFTLPALDCLTEPSTLPGKGPRVLILVPTRELAMQVANEATKYSKYLTRAKTVCVYGGVPYPLQNRQLARPYDILVATPGRLIDHLNTGKIDLSRVEVFILDEADRMLDMGFIPAVEEVVAKLPENRQTLMFSATLKGSVLKLSKTLLRNPVEIRIEPDYSQHQNIDQKLHAVDNLTHKYQLLEHLLSGSDFEQTIVFTATKQHTEELVDKLSEMGYKAAAMHGDMRQRERTRTIANLRQGKLRILVATDVAARGIDIPTISHVINFDLPRNAEEYVHRIGRTGRAGASGIAVSFAASKDMHLVKRIEQFTGQRITPFIVPGMEAKSFMAAPKSNRPKTTSYKQKPKAGFGKSFGGGFGGGFGGNGGNKPSSKFKPQGFKAARKPRPSH